MAQWQRMGTQNPGFGYSQCHGKMGWKQVEQGFSSFFAKCLPHLMIYQSEACRRHCNKTLKNQQLCQKPTIKIFDTLSDTSLTYM